MGAIIVYKSKNRSNFLFTITQDNGQSDLDWPKMTFTIIVKFRAFTKYVVDR